MNHLHGTRKARTASPPRSAGSAGGRRPNKAKFRQRQQVDSSNTNAVARQENIVLATNPASGKEIMTSVIVLFGINEATSFNCEYEVKYSSRKRSLFNLRGGNVLLNFNGGYTVVAENMIYERGFMEFLDNGHLVGEVSNIRIRIFHFRWVLGSTTSKNTIHHTSH